MTVFQTPIGNIDSGANRDIVGNLFSSGDGGGIAVCLLIDTSSPLGILPTSHSRLKTGSRPQECLAPLYFKIWPPTYKDKVCIMKFCTF